METVAQRIALASRLGGGGERVALTGRLIRENTCDEFRVQSLFELTNSKPTKLALKAVPSEQRTYAAMEHHMHTIRLQRT